MLMAISGKGEAQGVCTENPKSDHNDDEVRPGWHVNE
jgi:hypothetical protein